MKPERDQNNELYRRLNWWLFGRNSAILRAALSGLPRYIATVETAKHRLFVFQPADTLPDNKLICIASGDAYHLGVLSSRCHGVWALAAGGLLEDRPVYVKSAVFDPFPFPAATPAQAAEIAALADELDSLRRARLAAHPTLTLTTLYNVLAALRAGEPLSPAARDVLDAGHVEVLRHLHDRLDAAVAAAYGWPADLSAAAIVERVVVLNHARAAEEAEGQVRWLRPDYQAPAEQPRRASQSSLGVMEAPVLPPWPKLPGAQFVALRAMLGRTGPACPADLARRFENAPGRKISGMLRTLAELGQARQAGAGRYAA